MTHLEIKTSLANFDASVVKKKSNETEIPDSGKKRTRKKMFCQKFFLRSFSFLLSLKAMKSGAWLFFNMTSARNAPRQKRQMTASI